MSEDLMTAVRIIELSTKAGIEIVKLGYHCSLSSYRKLRDIYHAHILDQAGEMSYGTLLRHVGSDTQILNFETEDPVEVRDLKKGMTDYKISFVEMPDLKKGDGCTQFMVDASDAPKVNAFLRTYTQIAKQYITADQYTATGTKEQWDAIHKKALAEKMREKDVTAPDMVAEGKREPSGKGDEEAHAESMADRKLSVPDQDAIDRLRRDEIFRQASLQDGAGKITFPPEALASETDRSMLFHLGDGETVFALSKDHVHMERGQYTAVLLPDEEYPVMMNPSSKPGAQKDASLDIRYLRGMELTRQCMEYRMEKAEQAAREAVKEAVKEMAEKMPVK